MTTLRVVYNFEVSGKRREVVFTPVKSQGWQIVVWIDNWSMGWDACKKFSPSIKMAKLFLKTAIKEYALAAS